MIKKLKFVISTKRSYEKDIKKIAEKLSNELKKKPQTLSFSIETERLNGCGYPQYDLQSITKGRSRYRWDWSYDYSVTDNTIYDFTLKRKKKPYKNKFKLAIKLDTLTFLLPSLIRRIEPRLYSDKKDIYHPDSDVKIFGPLWYVTGQRSTYIQKAEFDVDERKIYNVTGGKHEEIDCLNVEQVLDSIGGLILKNKNDV